MQFQVVLCFGNSVASTRFLLQDEFNIQTTQCDNCIIVLSLSLLHTHTHTHELLCVYKTNQSHLHFPYDLTGCEILSGIQLDQLLVLYLGFHVLPPTNCLHFLHHCYDRWKWRDLRGFSDSVLLVWYGVLHVRKFYHMLLMLIFSMYPLLSIFNFCRVCACMQVSLIPVDR